MKRHVLTVGPKNDHARRGHRPGRRRLQQQLEFQHQHHRQLEHARDHRDQFSRAPSTVSTSQCGTKPGVAATGTPIALGAIVTNQPGTSFTDIPNMANAYFACVNANGGINGHPIKLYIETEQTNPAQIAADAKQLVQTDHVVGIIGNTSIIECSVDSSYWQKLGYYIIDSGHRPRVLLDAEQRRGQHGPAVQLGRRGAVRAGPARVQDRVRPVERPRHRLHRGRPGRAG